jgi:hypothetical protein
MEIFWIVVYAYAAVIFFAIALGIRKEISKEFWGFIMKVSDHIVKKWDQDFYPPKTLQSDFRL